MDARHGYPNKIFTEAAHAVGAVKPLDRSGAHKHLSPQKRAPAAALVDEAAGHVRELDSNENSGRRLAGRARAQAAARPAYVGTSLRDDRVCLFFT